MVSGVVEVAVSPGANGAGGENVSVLPSSERRNEPVIVPLRKSG
jgi:hypothetical protein